MVIKMTLNLHWDHILITIDFENAFNELEGAAGMERHKHHSRLNMMGPYWRAKLGPRSQFWSSGDPMWHDESLV